MPATAATKISAEALADLFRRANAAAIAADPGPGLENDGGSCNCDTPAFRIEGGRDAKIQEAARLAGVEAQAFNWLGSRRWYWLRVPLNGQAMRRTRMMEAAQRVLRDAQDSGDFPGLVACGYMQAD